MVFFLRQETTCRGFLSIFARHGATDFRLNGATRKSDARETPGEKKVTKHVSHRLWTRLIIRYLPPFFLNLNIAKGIAVRAVVRGNQRVRPWGQASPALRATQSTAHYSLTSLPLVLPSGEAREP